MSEPHDAHNQHVVEGGGGGAAAPKPAYDPVEVAVAHLELLGEETRAAVLAKMDPQLAERIRLRLDSMPDRPHGEFSRDVVARRKMLREMSERIHADKTVRQAQAAAQHTTQAARPGSPARVAEAAGAAPASPYSQPVAASMLHEDPLDALRVLHPAAIARAMQGERAEAWAIVLDRLDVNARGALQMYLEPPARAAIDEARARQTDLRATAPQLVDTIETAIARTVVPRAMREHHHLLSTNPPSWDAPAAGMEGSWQHA